MPEPDQSANESTGKKQPSDSGRISRRQVLSSTAATGALLLGVDTAAAHGQGGQAVVKAEHFEAEKSFKIEKASECGETLPDGSCEEERLLFQCEGKGGAIPFPWWDFYYLDADGEDLPTEDNPGKLYTRDNEVKIGITYRWPGNEKLCEESYHDEEDAIQTGFVAGSADK